MVVYYSHHRHKLCHTLLWPILFQVGCAHVPFLWSRQALDPATVARVRQEMNLAETACDIGDLSAAEVHLTRACQLNPKMVECHVRLGKIRNQRQLWNEAKSTWLTVTKLDAEEPAGWIGLAEAETALGEFEPAMNHLLLAIDLSPHRAEPHVKLGELYEAKGQPQEALQAYLNCLNIDTDHSTALLRVARLQRERGQFTQAIVRLDRVLELTPDNPGAYLERGLAHRDQGQMKMALADIGRALKLQPDRDDIKLELALLMETADDKQEALRLVREVLDSSPQLVGAKELGERLIR